MALPDKPLTRKEAYLSRIAGQATQLPSEPLTREEMYLDYIAKNGGGGSGDGDMKKSAYDSDESVLDAGGIKAYVAGAISGKVDVETGKGLSENDYTDADKEIVNGVTTALGGKVDKVEGKGLSENDYTDADKTVVGGVTEALAGKQDALTWNGNYLVI